MQKIKISRRNYQIPNREEFQELANWFVTKYITSDSFIDVEVRMSKKLQKLTGLCEKVSDNCYNVHISMYQSKPEMMRTLIHELIHVKQYYLREMMETFVQVQDDEFEDEVVESSIIIWKGEPIDTRKVSYNKLPWELDAFKNEGKIYGIWKRTKQGRKYY